MKWTWFLDVGDGGKEILVVMVWKGRQLIMCELLLRNCVRRWWK